jgi:hypothetical protein
MLTKTAGEEDDGAEAETTGRAGTAEEVIGVGH